MSPLPPLGDGGLNLPYEANPEPTELTVTALMAGGLVLLAASTDVGERTHPAMIFRFARPDGQFLPDIMLVAAPAELKGMVAMFDSAIAGAIAGASARDKKRKAGGA